MRQDRQIRRDAISATADLLERHRNQVLDSYPPRFAAHFRNLLAELRRRATHRPRGTPSAASPVPVNGLDRRLYRHLFEVAAAVVSEHQDEVLDSRNDCRFNSQFYSIVAEFQRRSGVWSYAVTATQKECPHELRSQDPR